MPDASTTLKNHFLLAMPRSEDPNFKDAVIYICEHNEEGAMGLIINHPADASMSQVFDEFELDYAEEVGRAPLLVGGPVEQERGFVLHRASTKRWESTLYVSDEICITASRDIIEDIAEKKGPTTSYITLGYAGWAPGQLELEIASNYWLVSESDPTIIFDTPFAERMKATATKLGIDLDRMSSQAGHA